MASVANGVVGGTVHVPNGSITAVTQNLATTGTVDAQTMYLTVDGTAGSFTATLPLLATFLGVGGQTAIAGSTRLLYIKRTDAVVANTVTLDGSGAETIDGAATAALGASNGLILAATSAGWRSVATDSITSTVSPQLPNNVPLLLGSTPSGELEYISGTSSVSLVSLPTTDANSANLALSTGTASSATGARTSGSLAASTGAVTAAGTAGGASGAIVAVTGSSTVSTAHTGGNTGSVTIASGSSDSTNAGGTGGATGAVVVGSGDALSTLGTSGNSGGVTIASGASADATTGNIAISTGNGVTSGGILLTTGIGSTTRGAITMADTNGSYRMADQVQRAFVTIPGGNGAGNVGDLASTPVTVIAAPGADRYIEFVSAHFWLDFATTPYDVAATTQLRYVGGNSLIATAIPTALLISAAADLHVNPLGTTTNVVPLANTAIELFTSADPFGAAGDSPLKVELFYRVRDFTPS